MTVQAELAQDERQAAELAGVTWQPEISKMAQTLQRRDADEDSFMRLTRTRTNKTQVIDLLMIGSVIRSKTPGLPALMYKLLKLIPLPYARQL